MEDQGEDGEACPEDDGVAGVTELPGPVWDPDIQQADCSYQEVAGNVFKVQLVFLWGVEGAPVDGRYQD